MSGMHLLPRSRQLHGHAQQQGQNSTLSYANGLSSFGIPRIPDRTIARAATPPLAAADIPAADPSVEQEAQDIPGQDATGTIDNEIVGNTGGNEVQNQAAAAGPSGAGGHPPIGPERNAPVDAGHSQTRARRARTTEAIRSATGDEIKAIVTGVLCRDTTNRHPHLRDLISAMIDNAALSRALSTWQQYVPDIRRWIAFCAKVRESPLGQDPVVAAAFLTETRRAAAVRNIGPGTVERASASISAFYELAGLQSPCAHSLCANAREVARRTLQAKQRNLGVATAQEVEQLASHHLNPQAPLLTRMVVTCAVLAFCGLLRFDDLSHILVHTDLLRIYADRAEVFLFKSKTDQHCRGTFVTIGRIDSPFCPVRLLEELLQAGQYKRKPAVTRRDGKEEDAEDVG
ncbi:hypothetical protein Agub_g3044, partial [Astrephomene gubernaculifera]